MTAVVEVGTGLGVAQGFVQAQLDPVGCLDDLEERGGRHLDVVVDLDADEVLDRTEQCVGASEARERC